jgi:hypothetical protein
MENGNFRLHAANEKRKQQISDCLLQTETKVCCPWSANDKR